MIETIPQ